jgi:hypothetical protein
MLARDPVEAVEQAKSFMATHSLSEYCDEIVRPALILGQKDAERGVLKAEKTKVLRDTIESLFLDLAHEHWVSRKEAHVTLGAPARQLPFLEKDQLGLSWHSKDPLALFSVRTDLDEAAAIVLATILEVHGIKARVERSEALAALNLSKLDLSETALIFLSSIDAKNAAHIQYAARRVRNRAPDAKILLGVWSATDDKPLIDLKDALNADYVARTFYEAASIILQEAIAGQRAPANIASAVTTLS